MPKKTKVQLFREKATPEEWQKIVELYEKAENKNLCLSGQGYDFTFSAVRNDLKKLGLIPDSEPKKEKEKMIEEKKKSFIIPDAEDLPDPVTRSVRLYPEVDEKLKQFCSKKRQYTSTAIINRLLDVAIDMYS